jgi:hypothetical protein
VGAGGEREAEAAFVESLKTVRGAVQSLQLQQEARAVAIAESH